MAKRTQIQKQTAKNNAKQLLQRKEKAEIYEKGLIDAAKHFAAGSFFPVDVAEGVTQGAFTPPASYKAAMMRPPVPSDYQIDPETGKPVFKGKQPVVNPEYKGTTEHVGKQLGVDIADPGGLAPQAFSPDPFAKVKALGILGKLGWENLAGLGALYGGLKKVGKGEKAEDVAKPIFTSPGKAAAADISKETIPANKVKNQLEGRGVSKDEMEWTGFNDWIKTKKGEVSKAEIEEFFEQNQIQVQEVLKGSLTSDEEFRKIALADTADELRFLMSNDKELYTYRDEIHPLIDRLEDGTYTPEDSRQLNEWFKKYGHDDEEYVSSFYERALNRLSDEDVPGQVRYPQKNLQLPGGENYRELLLRVPAKQVPWTKENVVPISGEEYAKTNPEAAAAISRVEGLDAFWFFKTPYGAERIPKKNYRATELPEGYSIKPLTERRDAQFTLERPDGGGRILFNAQTEEEALKDALQSLEMRGEVTIPKQEFNISQEEALEQILTRQPTEPKPRFTGGHWDESDVIAHIRFNERVDPDGNKVLFIEEIQSDWAHSGKDKGFKTPESDAIWLRQQNIKMRQNVITDEISKYNASSPYGSLGEEGQKELDKVTAQMNEWSARQGRRDGSDIPEVEREIAEQLKQKMEKIKVKYDPNHAKKQELIEEHNVLQREFNEIKDKISGREVQPGPFVTDAHQWTNLALKRMIRWASDEGFDSIAWVTGRQSAERYNVSKVVDEIEWYDMGIRSETGAKAITLKGVTPAYPDLEIYTNKEGLVKFTDIGGEEFKGKHIRDILGKGLGDKILSENKGVLKDADLDIGGQYHQFIYDKVLTEQAKKIGKKHGAKVEEGGVIAADYSTRRKAYEENFVNQYEIHEIRDYPEVFEDEIADIRHAPQETVLVDPNGEYVRDPGGDIAFFDNELGAKFRAEHLAREASKEMPETELIKMFPDADEGAEKVWTMRLTDKLKEASREGLPYYMVLPPLVIGGAAAQRTDAQKQQAKTDAQAILNQ